MGITTLDTAYEYGPHTKEILMGKAVKGIRDKVQICTKCGLHAVGHIYLIRGDPEYVRSACEGRLKSSIVEMKKLVQEGKVKYIRWSEASAADICRPHAVHPITAVQIEYSLWTGDVEDMRVCIVSYSPLARGFFCGKNVAEFTDDDYRKTAVPRFFSENFEKNRKLYEQLCELGAKMNCPPGQLALAWNKGTVPIPGTRPKNLEENVGALNVKLTADEIQSLEAAVPPDEVQGDRYKDMNHTWSFRSSPLDSWTGARQA
ncbi:hypothetical protein Mapa_014301 [Marchantia paleacea]|nr:hypothetical protein Mapa_014301 [Marchantia paleacea]